jgi:membrane dipeptidase
MPRKWILLSIAPAFLVLVYSWSRQTEANQVRPAGAPQTHGIWVDGHEHITNRVYFEGIDPWKPQITGLWDYARAKQGGLNVVIENVWADDGYNNYNVTTKQVVRLIETFYRVLDANRDKMELALTAADARRIVASGKMAVVLAIECGFDMEGDVDVLRLFHRLGVRLVQFVNHNTTNAYADAGLGEQKWHGITDHGRALIREMNRLGIIIDISHASDVAELQIIEASQTPVTGSHHGLRHFSNHPRNLSDEVVKALSAKGGLVGLHSSAAFLSQAYYAWSQSHQRPPQVPLPNTSRSPDQDYGKYIAALDNEIRSRWRRDYSTPWRELSPPDAPLPTVDEWATQMDYLVKLAGIDHVGIGLDMNAGGSNIRDFDATGYRRLADALKAKGYSQADVDKIMGQNWLQLMDAAKLPASSNSGQ